MHILLVLLLFGFNRVAAFVWWTWFVVVLVVAGLIFLGSQLPDKRVAAPKLEPTPKLLEYPFDSR